MVVRTIIEDYYRGLLQRTITERTITEDYYRRRTTKDYYIGLLQEEDYEGLLQKRGYYYAPRIADAYYNREDYFRGLLQRGLLQRGLLQKEDYYRKEDIITPLASQTHRCYS
eukprot:COSAG05_NODE_6969_length_873_cov_1.313953_1_plen_112_part_00